MQSGRAEGRTGSFGIFEPSPLPRIAQWPGRRRRRLLPDDVETKGSDYERAQYAETGEARRGCDDRRVLPVLGHSVHLLRYCQHDIWKGIRVYGILERRAIDAHRRHLLLGLLPFVR